MRQALRIAVGLALLGGLLGVARFALAPSHASGDAFWYARLALEYHGYSEAEATSSAAQFIVAEGRGGEAEDYVELAGTIDPRYPAIFASRPVYPLVVSAILTFANLSTAMTVGALLAGVVFAGVFGWFTGEVTSSPLAALVAVGLSFALPSGQWFAYMYADGWMLAFLALAMVTASLYLRHGRGRYLWFTLLSVGLVYLTKPANGAVFVAGMVLLGFGSLVLRSDRWKEAVGLGAASLVLGIVQVIVFQLLKLPGFETTLQDMFTLHFASPDVDNVFGRLLSRDWDVVSMAVASPFHDPVMFGLALVLLVGLVMRRTAWATAWLVIGCAAVLTVLAHPVTSEFPRLLAPIWISAALGGGLWIVSVRKHWSNQTE
jgi:hypothetical protein